MILANGCNITKSEKFKGVWILSVPTVYIYIYIPGKAKSLWTPHIQHTPSLNCCRLVDATELWAPEWPDTGTVSSPKQSISWTPDINVEHTTLFYNYLFTTHTYIIYIFFFFPFQICTSDLYTHDCLYCIVFFAILYIAYLYICILFFCCLCPVLLLSFCCTVELCHYNKFLVCVNIPGQ